MNPIELENRLIEFSVKSYLVCLALDKTDLGKYLSQQLTRSAASSALNYGEAQGAESKKDFIHKARITLKELKESYVSHRIIEEANICGSPQDLSAVMRECN